MRKKIILIFLALILFGTGFFSAVVCCEKKLTGGWCVSAESESECDLSGGFSFSPTSCEATSFCTPGCCYDSESGMCSENSPKKSCSGGEAGWTAGTCSSNSMCVKGCCTSLGRNTDWMTKKRCIVESQKINKETVFDQTISQDQCFFSSGESDGACLLATSGCTRTNSEDCLAQGGNFKEGFLCSYYENETGCIKQKEKKCGDPEQHQYEVYWYDSCENRENIYEGENRKSSSWNEGKIKSKEKVTCKGDSENPNGCGNCNYPESSICAELNPNEYGCKSVDCRDEYEYSQPDSDRMPLTRKNGESWCVFEGHIDGEYGDVVGSDHWRRYCENGEIKTERCGYFRDEVCGETRENGFSQATCRINEGWRCPSFDSTEECEQYPEFCKVLEVSVPYKEPGDIPVYGEGRYDANMEGTATFQICSDFCSEGQNVEDCISSCERIRKGSWEFKACVPKYSIGIFESSLTNSESDTSDSDEDEEETEAETRCDLATTSCKSTWISMTQTETDASYCFVNCGCGRKNEFTTELNDLCISMGDCGAYINTEKAYTKNYDLEGRHDDIGVTKEKIKDYKDQFQTKNILSNENSEPWEEENKNGYNIISSGISGEGGDFPEELIKFDKSNYNLPSEFKGNTHHENSKESKFECLPWEPPLNSENCEKCNDEEKTKGIPCTEYKCWSFGENCRVKDAVQSSSESEENSEGETQTSSEKKICYDAGCGSREVPSIKNPEVVTAGYDLIESGNSAEIKEKNKNGVQEFRRIEFVLETEDYAECKYGIEIPVSIGNFEEDANAQLTEEGTGFSKTHTIILDMPQYDDTIIDSGDANYYEIYVTCRSLCEIIGSNPYKVKFKINQEPDTKEPSIKTDPEGDSYMPFGVNISELKIIGINEPLGECRYSFSKDVPYNQMENIIGSCTPAEYSCEGIVTGLKKPEPESIYIKCEDIAGNSNTADLQHNFIKSQSGLIITSVVPADGTLRKDPVNETNPLILSITTFGGINAGVSKCTWGIIGVGSQENEFIDGETTTHSVEIKYLNPGKYTAEFKCRDSANNKAENKTNFIFEKDIIPPSVVRIFREGGSINLVTNEQAVCYYDNSSSPSCGFIVENSMPIDGYASEEHRISAERGKDYYVKCEDLYGNVNGGCAVIVREG